jgi:hypothetical protein
MYVPAWLQTTSSTAFPTVLTAQDYGHACVKILSVTVRTVMHSLFPTSSLQSSDWGASRSLSNEYRAKGACCSQVSQNPHFTQRRRTEIKLRSRC